MFSKSVRRGLAGVAAGGLIAAGGVAWAAPGDPFAVNSDQFSLSTEQCSGVGWSISFRTQVAGTTTADEDFDVNVGDTVSAMLESEANGDQYIPDATITYEFDGAEQQVGPGDAQMVGGEWAPLMEEAAEYSVTEEDAGEVLTVQATEFVAPQTGVGTCVTDPDNGIVGLYVNEPPRPVDDEASTDPDASVTVDVLANDDATWDSGTIESAYPTAEELAGQDDLAEVPEEYRGDAVGIVTEPENGTVVVEDDGQITYTPEAGFIGDDVFEYSLTDNDGASTTAEVLIEVVDVTDSPAPADPTPPLRVDTGK